MDENHCKSKSALSKAKMLYYKQKCFIISKMLYYKQNALL